MSKKNQKVQLATMSTEAIALLSGFSVAITEIKKLTDAHKTAVDAVKKNIETLMTEVEEGEKLGTLTAERKSEIEQLLYVLQKKIVTLDNALKDDKKPYIKAKKSALALVPENIYSGYKSAWESGKTAVWNADIRAFLKATGVEVGNDTAVQNFADIMTVRCSGSKNASAKDESGRLLAVKGQRTFEETVMKTFIDYCVVEKGVLDRAEDGTITRHDFNANDAE